MSLTSAIALAAALALTPGAPPAPPAATAPPVKEPGWTGAASEEEFKKMHELRKDAPPALRGMTVDIAGTKSYLSLPKDAKPGLPGVIVIQEWWGLNDHIKHWADRLAAEGYAALAVDLYDGKVATNPDDAMKYMQGVDEARALKVLAAGYEFLGSDPRIKATKRGTIGWCFGGHWSLRTAMAEPGLNAAVMYYGRPVLQSDQLEAIKAPILGIWGKLDQGIPPATVKEFDASLTKAGVAHEFHSYDAVHAFANPSNAKYDQVSAGDAWAKARAFLAAHLR